jgi:hypothetical protein
MRVRLRPAPSETELAELYPAPHDHTRWSDHIVRVDVTIALARNVMRPGGTVADLSCGNAAIAKALAASHSVRLRLGDYAPGYELTGPITQTIAKLGHREADLFICSETIEHLDEPDLTLRLIRDKASMLILSTPDGETDTGNPEHLWGWDTAAVRAMLAAARWEPAIYTSLDLRPAGFLYCYQIWVCR